MSQLYSYSRVGCFATCPLQYAHRYIRKTPSPLPEGGELFMGSRFHETMEYLYGQVPARVPKLDEVLGRFDQVWDEGKKTLLAKQKQKGYASSIRIAKEGETLEDYRGRARTFVERYYEKYQPFDQDRTVPGGIEKRVVFSLDPSGLYRMQGYIDRVAQAPDGTLVVHDYKTGSRKHNPGDSEKEDQLALYQVGLSQDPLFKDATFRLRWHYVAFEDDVMEIRRTPDDLEGLKKTYIHKIQTIEKAETFDPQPSPLCGWCEFLPLCPKGQAEVDRRKKKKEETTPAPASTGSSVPPSSRIPQGDAPAPPVEASPLPSPRSKRKSPETSPDQLSFF